MGIIPLPAELLAQVDLGGGVTVPSITYTLRIPPGSSELCHTRGHKDGCNQTQLVSKQNQWTPM